MSYFKACYNREFNYLLILCNNGASIVEKK